MICLEPNHVLRHFKEQAKSIYKADVREKQPSLDALWLYVNNKSPQSLYKKKAFLQINPIKRSIINQSVSKCQAMQVSDHHLNQFVFITSRFYCIRLSLSPPKQKIQAWQGSAYFRNIYLNILI